MTNVEKDTVSRNRIVSEIDRNFFVEAGAGSGKTTMLVSRMVAMVEAGIDIQKICSITFTKAAAGEFYDRFQKLLIERSNPSYVWVDKGYAGQLPAPTEESRERCLKALQNIDLCFMGTIDSFCSMVLSEHPSEAGIPSDATIMSDMDAKSLYKQIYVQICAGEHGDRLKELAKIFRILHWNADEVFIAGESLFMNNRNVHFKFNRCETVDIDKAFAAEKEAINKALKVLVMHPELAYEGNKNSLAAWEKLPDVSRKLNGRWSNNFSGVLSSLKALKDLRVLPVAMDKYGNSLADCLVPGGAKNQWLEFSPTQKGGLQDKLDDMSYDVSMTFLSECVPVIEQAMRDKGAMTFFDYLYYLRNMLKKDAAGDGKLIRYIYDRHSYFLIDEFQDTNPMQAEVFFYLASEHPVEQWSACVPRPGSLFIVGDPKQSIYRFRSADVTSFLRVKKLFEENGGDILYLSRNFRSTKKIIDYFNNVFTDLLPEETTVQSKFEEIPLPDKDSTEFQGIYKYTAYTSKLGEEHPGETDPEQIRKIIERIVNQDKYRVSVDGCAPRPIEYSDIMVISYGKGKINGIMRALDEAGIPMRVEGKVPFERNEALAEIYYIYSAVADTNDKNALFNALKGRLIRSCEEEMMKLRLAGGEISLAADNSLPEDAHPTAIKVAGCIDSLKALAVKAAKLSPAALFAEIMDGYEVYRIAPAENLEVLYYTLELLRNAEKTGIVVSLKDGADYLGKLLSGGADEERCLSLNDSKKCVHIANLHKVKGLEAPIVILAAATTFNSNISSRIVHKDNGSEGYIFSVSSERNEGKAFKFFKTEKFSDEEEAEKEVISAEHIRLIYVGATRVRNALIICDSLAKSGKGEGHRSIWKDLLAQGAEDIFEATADVEIVPKQKACTADIETLYKEAGDNCALNCRDMESATYKVENPSHARLSSKLAEDEVDVIDVPDEDTKSKSETISGDSLEVHRFPTLLGTMTHRLMEVIVSTGNTANTDSVIAEIIREYRTPKNQPFESKLSKALKTVSDKMMSGGYPQSNGVPQDLLSVLLAADQVYCEVPFCYKDEEDGFVTVWNGVMDVIYCENGNWHIIDYKTNIDGSNLDARYKAQLSAYKKAFKATTGNDADAYTYHIDV